MIINYRNIFNKSKAKIFKIVITTGKNEQTREREESAIKWTEAPTNNKNLLIERPKLSNIDL